MGNVKNISEGLRFLAFVADALSLVRCVDETTLSIYQANVMAPGVQLGVGQAAYKHMQFQNEHMECTTGFSEVRTMIRAEGLPRDSQHL
jgi:hypothetical protein